jgi:hypothetical protein
MCNVKIVKNMPNKNHRLVSAGRRFLWLFCVSSVLSLGKASAQERAVNMDSLRSKIIDYDYNRFEDVTHLANFITSISPNISLRIIEVKNISDLSKRHGFYNPISDSLRVNLFSLGTKSYINNPHTYRKIENDALQKEVNIRNFQVFFVLVHELEHLNQQHLLPLIGLNSNQLSQLPPNKEINSVISELLLLRKMFLETIKIKQVTYTNGHDKVVFDNPSIFGINRLERNGGVKNAHSRQIIYEKPELVSFVDKVFGENKSAVHMDSHEYLRQYVYWMDQQISRNKPLREVPSDEEINLIVKLAINRMNESGSQYAKEMPFAIMMDMQNALKKAYAYLDDTLSAKPVGFTGVIDAMYTHTYDANKINFIKPNVENVKSAVTQMLGHPDFIKSMKDNARLSDRIDKVMPDVSRRANLPEYSAYDIAQQNLLQIQNKEREK